MEWVIAVLAVALLVYYVLPRRTPRTFDGVPTITPDMIHPRDRPPTRIEAATAYRNFCFRYLGSPADPRENTDVADFLAMLSADIQALDPVRDETANRIKEAMNELREARAADDVEWISEVEETIRRRRVRLEAQDAVIAAKKADCRAFLVETLNDRVAEMRELFSD